MVALTAGGGLVMLAMVLARPLTATYEVWRARYVLMQHEPQQAAGWLEAAYRRSPRRGEIQFWLARVRRRLDDYDALQKHLARARELGWSADRIDREQRLALVQSGQLPPESPEASAMLVQPGEDSLEIYQAFTRAYIEAFQIPPALRLLDGWQADFPQDAQPYYYRGLISKFEQDWPAAEAAFREALVRNPRRSDARLQLAHALREQYQFRSAAAHYRRCLEEREDVESLYGLAQSSYNLGDLDEARSLLRRAIEKDSDFYDALVTLGEIDVSLGHGPEALPALEKAVAVRPHEFKSRHLLAWALVLSGRKNEAREHFQAAGEAQVTTVRVRSLTALALAAPDQVEPRLQVGAVLLENGQTDLALDWLRGALRIQPDHRPTHALLAQLFERQGQADLASEHRRLAEGRQQ